jgi:hypothetical protein
MNKAVLDGFSFVGILSAPPYMSHADWAKISNTFLPIAPAIQLLGRLLCSDTAVTYAVFE